MKKTLQALGCLLLVLASWLVGTKGGGSSPAQHQAGRSGPDQPSTPPGEATVQAGSIPKPASTRPALKNRPMLLGRKVTVLEGTISESGSEGPVKFQNHLGMIFSAAAIRQGEGDEILLVAPVEVTGDALEGTIRKREGVLTLSRDGELKAEGDMDFQSAAPEKAVQSRQE